MTGPTWLTDAVAATMGMTAIYCIGRIAVSRLQGRVSETGVDLVHVAMGLGMADMLLRPAEAGVNRLGVIGFAAATGYFLFRGLRRYVEDGYRPVDSGHQLQHALGSGAMLFMFAPGSRAAMVTSSMSGMNASGLDRVTPAAGLLALLLLGFALATVGRLVSSAGRPTPSSPPLLAPRLALCCQALMGASMCYALLAI